MARPMDASRERKDPSSPHRCKIYRMRATPQESKHCCARARGSNPPYPKTTGQSLRIYVELIFDFIFSLPNSLVSSLERRKREPPVVSSPQLCGRVACVAFRGRAHASPWTRPRNPSMPRQGTHALLLLSNTLPHVSLCAQQHGAPQQGTPRAAHVAAVAHVDVCEPVA